MAIINKKEITKKLNCGLKCIREAVAMARGSIVVEIIRPGSKPATKVKRTRKPRTKKPGAELPTGSEQAQA